MKEIDDEWVFPWGKHKGTKIGEVPADYLDWLDGQAYLDNWVRDYIKRNRKCIDLELKRMGIQ